MAISVEQARAIVAEAESTARRESDRARELALVAEIRALSRSINRAAASLYEIGRGYPLAEDEREDGGVRFFITSPQDDGDWADPLTRLSYTRLDEWLEACEQA